MSILGEYLQRVKAERDDAVKLLKEAREEIDAPVWSRLISGVDDERSKFLAEIDAFLSRYDLPDDYDEA